MFKILGEKNKVAVYLVLMNQERLVAEATY